MEKYYKIALPLNITDLYTYKSKNELKTGIRVLIKFNNAVYTGFVIEEDKAISKSIKYESILEIIDKEKIINEELINFSKWISQYYHIGLGQVLSAALPGALNVQYVQRIKKLKDFIADNVEDTISERILLNLSKVAYTDFADLKEKVNIPHLYYWLEKLEEEGIIEIERKIDKKIKPKIVNFIIVKNDDYKGKLGAKQKELYEKIKGLGREFRLSIIAKEYSYAVVRGLKDKGIIDIVPRAIKEKDEDENIIKNKRNPKVIKYTKQQSEIIERLIVASDKNKFIPFLLFGITGSGKTEVYIRIIKQILSKNKSAILLLPEIALTPQVIAKFYNEFSDQIAVIHSHLSQREKYRQWRSIKRGEKKVVIGARSAIFAPVSNLGIIIVDEEHETSYKQDNNPRYNARDLAVVRAKMNNALVVLGTATPSLESWYNVNLNRYNLLLLTQRPFAARLPEIEVIDMRKVENQTGNFSDKLIKEIEKRLENREQVILFQNRRGYSSFVQCINCGELFKCPNCEISLHYHSITSELKCHYCGYTTSLPRKCPKCGSYVYNFGAPGTQRIEKELSGIFPNARILRMDSDTTVKKDSYKEMFERMKNGDVDILLGTQMISKGLDFHNVTLVGVISADVMLNYPDFRSSERTFQLLTQVAGRAGRGEKAGKVIIQTYNPEHFAITDALNNDFELFAIKELKFRKNLKYPPYYRIARFLFSHKNYDFLKENLDKNKDKIIRLKKTMTDIFVLGPIIPPIAKIKNQYRMHIIIKAKSPSEISKAVNYLNKNIKISGTIKKIIDIDAYSLI